MTEPNYTDAQIEAMANELKATKNCLPSVNDCTAAADMLRQLLSERQAAMQGQGGEVVVAAEDARECVMEAIAGALGDAFDCTRVWSAWSYGTMSEDDFSLVREDEGRLGEIADAAIAALQPPQPVCVCNTNSNLTGAEAEKPDALFLAESANFIRTHHAAIQQNAEAAKRLRALERALAAISPLVSTTAYKIRKRADEILREGEPHDQD